MQYKTIITLFMLFSFSVVAEQHTYKGKVEGMVCAFCTYNVGKKIAEFEGVDAATVNLDLKSGEVGFVSSVAVEKSKLAQLFTETGFKLVALEEVKSSQLSELKFNDHALISLSFAANKLSEFEDILDALGALAASQATQLSLSAPKDMEIDILKPIIAGRQRAIKVKFDAVNTGEIQIKLATAL
ncbi:MAG TPA: heavy-metal-associated domain-containing protein [Oceanospirillales bacterium]|nr:heavy-metal-associated domain-containing protein [Oceanospirillales bacterium]